MVGFGGWAPCLIEQFGQFDRRYVVLGFALRTAGFLERAGRNEIVFAGYASFRKERRM